MKNTKRKGFTIVELVIVIAVIAILAAVLIPTFASLVKKANQSADEQAVKQMNTQLAITEADGKPGTIGAAVLALNEVNINIDDYTPLITGRQFYWVKSENRVIYVNLEDNKILYPEQYETLEHKNGDWYSLNGNIEFKDYTVSKDKAVSIEEPGQFAKFVDDYNKGGTDAKKVTKITLSSDIDLAGATVKFLAKDTNGGVSGTIEIDGGEKTIYGLRDDIQTTFGSGDYAEKGYGYGLFGNISASGAVTIKNVTFNGMNVQDTESEETSTAGLLAGYIYGTLTLENVTFSNCSVTANQKVGAIVGQLRGTLTMENVKFTNTTVSGGCEVAKLAGYLWSETKNSVVSGGNLMVSGNNDFDGITTVSLVDTFKKDAFTVKCGNSNLILKGDSNNTFKYNPAYNGDTNSQFVGIWNVTTDDWAWYRIGSEESTWKGEGAATYNGKQCFLNGSSFSASTNFTSGKPASTN